jgi:hypothetical protein
MADAKFSEHKNIVYKARKRKSLKIIKPIRSKKSYLTRP